MCWFYDKQEWKEKQQHKFESHRTPFMKTTLELGQYWKGQLKTCNAIGGCIPPNFTFMYWLNAFSPAVQPLCGCQPGGSGAECSDAVLYSCPAVEPLCGCQPGGSGAECSHAVLYSCPAAQPLLWMPGAWFWCRVLWCYVDLLIREMQLPVISYWLLSYYQLLSRMEIFAALRWSLWGGSPAPSPLNIPLNPCTFHAQA